MDGAFETNSQPSGGTRFFRKGRRVPFLVGLAGRKEGGDSVRDPDLDPAVQGASFLGIVVGEG